MLNDNIYEMLDVTLSLSEKKELNEQLTVFKEATENILNIAKSNTYMHRHLCGVVHSLVIDNLVNEMLENNK